MGIKKNIQYRYTPTGQKSLMIDPDGGRHTYLYDAVKQLTAVINPQGERTSYSYDAGGRRTVKKLANGSRTSFSYDGANRMTTVAHLKSDAAVQAKYDYKHDKAGNRTAMSETGATTARTTYAYDAAYQLTGEHRTGANAFRNTYTYDNRGNRTLKNLDGARTTSIYDDANQLSWTQDAAGRTTYVYDGNGNQEVTITPSGSRTTNVWDYENRLVGVRHPSGSRETMAYDPDGKRVQHETGAATTKFVWNGQAYLLETDASGVTVATYTNEPTAYGRLISQRKSGATHYYVFDALGSTRLLTDSSQNIAESLLYDAWGNLVGSAPSIVVPFRWVGELGYLFVPSTGDYYIRQRIFGPKIGRWLSQDPLGLVDGSNRFTYTFNHPVLGVDPNGLWTLQSAAGEFCRRQCLDLDIRPNWGWNYNSCWERCYQHHNNSSELLFTNWYNIEAESLEWTVGIGVCPCSLFPTCIRTDGTIEWQNPRPSVWNDPSPISSWSAPYHPGAVYEMRSKDPNAVGAGQQCTYDAAGELIMTGRGAGTADRYVPPSWDHKRKFQNPVWFT